MEPSIKLLLVLVLLNLSCISQGVAQRNTDSVAQKQGIILSDVPQKVDAKARYLFYLHGYIVEAGNTRPTSPKFGVYEYQQILDTFKQSGFVVISEARKQSPEIEPYAAKVAGQVRHLLAAGVPPQNITVVGASQGSWIAMLASTYVKNRGLNFVAIGACSADDGLLELVDLHGNVLFISERTDLPARCERFRADATGLNDYKEVETNTGQKHGFLYRPMKEWVEPTVEWARTHAPDTEEQAVKEKERAYRDALVRGDTAVISALLADDFVATSSRGEIRDKVKELDDMKPSPDYKTEGFDLDDINVRIFGETAIVTGRQTLKVAFRGQSNTSVFRYTRVYVKRNNGWRVVAQQLTRLPQQ